MADVQAWTRQTRPLNMDDMQNHQPKTPTPTHEPDPDQVRGQLAKRSFATLATVSPTGRPHVAGVLYELANDSMYVNTLRTSRKARNIEANGRAAVCVIVRRLPVGPPSTIHFQSTAEVLDLDHEDVTDLLAAGELESLTSHGELDLPDGCFVRVKLAPRLLTYGLGMPLRSLIKDPLGAGGSVDIEPSRLAAPSAHVR